MKNLLLAVALLFATSTLFAQDCEGCDIDQIPTGPRGAIFNNSDVDQYGEDHLAVVNQLGMGNYSYVLQTDNWTWGNDNKAYVTQHGLWNHSIVEQNGDYNTGYVTQFGVKNFAKQRVGFNTYDAEYNLAKVYQKGEWNTSFQTQEGDGNDANVVQIGDGNYAEQMQTSSISNPFNIADIYQEGEGNAAKQTQTGKFNEAFSKQYGNDNTAVSVQNNAGLFANNYSLIEQLGNDNMACVDQNITSKSLFGFIKIGSNGINDSYILQDGNLNFANVKQTVDSVWLAGNESDVFQLGNSNVACVTQLATFAGH